MTEPATFGIAFDFAKLIRAVPSRSPSHRRLQIGAFASKQCRSIRSNPNRAAAGVRSARESKRFGNVGADQSFELQKRVSSSLLASNCLNFQTVAFDRRDSHRAARHRLLSNALRSRGRVPHPPQSVFPSRRAAGRLRRRVGISRANFHRQLSFERGDFGANLLEFEFGDRRALLPFAAEFKSLRYADRQIAIPLRRPKIAGCRIRASSVGFGRKSRLHKSSLSNRQSLPRRQQIGAAASARVQSDVQSVNPSCPTKFGGTEFDRRLGRRENRLDLAKKQWWRRK